MCVYIYIIIIIYEGQESALEPLDRLHVTRLHLMIECWGALLWDHSMPRRSRRRVTTYASRAGQLAVVAAVESATTFSAQGMSKQQKESHQGMRSYFMKITCTFWAMIKVPGGTRRRRRRRREEGRGLRSEVTGKG